jgi:ABC-type molybdate transport system permease subunit
LTVHVVLWVPPTVVGAVLLVLDGNSLSGLMKGVNEPDQLIIRESSSV